MTDGQLWRLNLAAINPICDENHGATYPSIRLGDSLNGFECGIQGYSTKMNIIFDDLLEL